MTEVADIVNWAAALAEDAGDDVTVNKQTVVAALDNLSAILVAERLDDEDFVSQITSSDVIARATKLQEDGGLRLRVLRLTARLGGARDRRKWGHGGETTFGDEGV